MATGWQEGRGCIRAPYLGTSFPMFAVTPRTGSESQVAGTCVTASPGRDAAKPRGVKSHAPGTWCPAEPLPPHPGSAPAALALLAQHVLPGQHPHLQTNPPAATSDRAQGPQARSCPTCSARAMPALSRLPTSMRSCPDKPVPLPLSPGLRFSGTVGSTSPPSISPWLPPAPLFWGLSGEPCFCNSPPI